MGRPGSAIAWSTGKAASGTSGCHIAGRCGGHPQRSLVRAPSSFSITAPAGVVRPPSARRASGRGSRAASWLRPALPAARRRSGPEPRSGVTPSGRRSTRPVRLEPVDPGGRWLDARCAAAAAGSRVPPGPQTEMVEGSGRRQAAAVIAGSRPGAAGRRRRRPARRQVRLTKRHWRDLRTREASIQ